jgi:hypothetical protein
MQLGPRAANAGGGGGSWQGGGKSFGGAGASASASASSPAQDGGDKDAVPSLDEIPVINLEEDEIKPEDIPF